MRRLVAKHKNILRKIETVKLLFLLDITHLKTEVDDKNATFKSLVEELAKV